MTMSDDSLVSHIEKTQGIPSLTLSLFLLGVGLIVGFVYFILWIINPYSYYIAGSNLHPLTTGPKYAEVLRVNDITGSFAFRYLDTAVELSNDWKEIDKSNVVFADGQYYYKDMVFYDYLIMGMSSYSWSGKKAYNKIREYLEDCEKLQKPLNKALKNSEVLESLTHRLQRMNCYIPKQFMSSEVK